jgi:hypothetical protein
MLVRRIELGDLVPIHELSIELPGVEPTSGPTPGAKLTRDYRAERLRASALFVEDLANIREQAARGTLDRDKWMCLVKVLLACPLPYRPTVLRQIPRRTRFSNRWVTITYTACRPKIALPFGADNKLLHWLFDLGIRQSQAATNQVTQDDHLIRYHSTRSFLSDCGMADSPKNYDTVKASFRRLTGLAITVEFEGDGEERGTIIPLLDRWNLPISIAQAAGTRRGASGDEYGFVLSRQLRDHSQEYCVRLPRQVWRLLKGRPLKSALLLWLFHRAWSAEGRSKIKWEILQDQFWYAKSSPRKLRQYVRRAITELRAVWPTANVHVGADGIVFDKAVDYLLPDNAANRRIRRVQNNQNG